MGLWLRVEEALLEHPKLWELGQWLEVGKDQDRVIGPGNSSRSFDYRYLIGLGCWVKLFMWCLKYAPTGDISNIDPVTLEGLIGWPGEPGQLMKAMMQAGFIDYECNPEDQLNSEEWIPTKLHDFEEYYERLNEHRTRHNDSQKRYRKRLKGAGDIYNTSRDKGVMGGDVTVISPLVSVEYRDVLDRDREGEQETGTLAVARVVDHGGGCEPEKAESLGDGGYGGKNPLDIGANAPHSNGEAPSEVLLSKVNGEQFQQQIKDIEAVCAHYLTFWPKRTKQVRSAKVRSKIRQRLAEGYSREELMKAVDGLMASDFHKENGHTSLELAVRDSVHVDRFLGGRAEGSGYKPSFWAKEQGNDER